MYQLAALTFIFVMATAAIPVQRLTPAQHARAGWEAIDAGRFREAAEAFTEALKGVTQEPTVTLGAGIAAHRLGHADTARRYLLDTLRLEPTLTVASILLGDILYQAGDIRGALQTYEQALVHAPKDEALTTRLNAWRSEAALHDKFGQKLSDHFTVLFEGPAEDALAQKAVDVLEAAYWRVGAALYTYPIEPITVVLYTREQFRDVTQSPDWAGGAYDGKIRVPVQGAMKNTREFERVLAHEFTHALVKSIAPRGVPQWLNEGLAMYFEGSDTSKQVALAAAAEPKHPLAKLEGPFSGMDKDAASVAYAQSVAAVKLLLDEAGAPAIVGVLSDLGRGLPFAEAFERNTNMSYVEFQKR
ncbi:MAG: tetratricopeptide repeat protein [Acidobacteria bacterium]|nr:tetratricopeptide repeat protein [Acidobacteriota bacterium]